MYRRLVDLFTRAHERYNSGLFHFKPEKGIAEQPDEFTLNLQIGDEPIARIVEHLYYPSPYKFDVIPIEILGQVYEQFLGKVIRITDDSKEGSRQNAEGSSSKSTIHNPQFAIRQVVIEDKPEVRKAGGVYYTPTYIVDYIVEQTVGKLLEGKTPKEAAGLRILDPACGSGSFLIGAYSYLLDWHLRWYTANDPESHAKKAGGRGKKADAPALVRVANVGDGAPGWRLSIGERKKILRNNIYGVDIDTQAVEVTKLSLLLKVLEGETRETLGVQLGLAGVATADRVLPDLGENIKSGNSLIGPDFYTSGQSSFLDSEEQYRINAFDWQSEFKEIMKAGGFDAVIGNPPYIRIQTMKEWAPLEVEHYKRRYVSASKGNYDIYVVFVEKGLELLNNRGRLGFILPHKFFNAQYGEPLRGLISQGQHLSDIVHFTDQQVFTEATTYTCLLFLTRRANDACHILMVRNLNDWRLTGHAEKSVVPAENVGAQEWNFGMGQNVSLFGRLNAMPVKLGDVAHLFVGLQTDADDVFILESVRQEGDRILCMSKATGKEHWFEYQHLKPFLKGSLNIRRYYLDRVTKRLIFPYAMKDGKSVLISQEDYREHYPLTWAYLEENRERLRSRNKGRLGEDWYGYVYKKNHTRFGLQKLLVPSIATGSAFAPDLEGMYYFVGSGGGGGGGYAITLADRKDLTYLYLLGVLNSGLLSTYLRSISTPFRGGYIALNRQYIEQLPHPHHQLLRPRRQSPPRPDGEPGGAYVEAAQGLGQREKPQ